MNVSYRNHLLLIVISILCPVLCSAGPVSFERARKVAESFLAINGHPSDVVEERAASTKAGDSGAFYIFNSEKDGFVIVSGDDAARPILAYSLTGRFDLKDAPDFISDWLEAISHDVRAARPSEEVSSQWSIIENKVQTKAIQGKVVLKTAEWGQRAPFNDKCPLIGGKRALTGCVATAGAIIMRYHRWPETYSWNLMPLTVTTAKNDAIAELMHEIGVLVQMDYGVDASSAKMGNLQSVLINKMNYVRSIKATSPTPLQSKEMIDRCSHEINNDRPVLISAWGSTNPGHAFVIDGYDTDGNLHINWGWTGQYNGFFTFPEFLEYRDMFTIYTGISKSESPNAELLFDGSRLEKLSPDSYRIRTSFLNSSEKNTYEGQVAIGRFSRFHELQEIVSDGRTLSIDPLGAVTEEFECKLSSSPELGEYLMPLHQPAGKDEYMPAIFVGTSPDSGKSALMGTEALEALTSFTYDNINNKIEVHTHPDAKVYTSLSEDEETEHSGDILLSGYRDVKLYITVRIGANSLRVEVVL